MPELQQHLRRRPNTVFLNSARLNYDHGLSFERLSEMTNLTLIDVDILHSSSDILSHIPPDTEIVITKEMEISKETFSQFPDSVQLLCEAGTGYNNLPTTCAKSRGVEVCNVPTYSTDSVAQLAITFMLNHSCSMREQHRMLDQKNDRSNFTGPFTLPLQELSGKVLGLVGGSGAIGSRVADIALALNMNVVIQSRSSTLPSTHHLAQQNDRVRLVTSLEDLMAVSDYVSIHCPLNDSTYRCIDGKMIRKMKPTAYLINTARGSILHEEELTQCLKERVICGAALDVVEDEPLSQDSELWTLDNCVLTPHIGWRRKETRQRLVDTTADNIQSYIDGNSINVV